MSAEREALAIATLQQAVGRLEEALAAPLDPGRLVVDATIQRFEFTLELTWKTLKRLLAGQGIQALTPRDSLKRAYQAGWFADESLWLEMLQARNETPHLYDAERSLAIYRRIRDFAPALRSLADGLQRHLAPPA